MNEYQPLISYSTKHNVSFKDTVAFCNNVRYSDVYTAATFAMSVINKKTFVSYSKHNKHMAHRKNGVPGRYPRKIAEIFLKELKYCLKSKQYTSYEQKDIVISEIYCNKLASVKKIIPRAKGKIDIGKKSYVKLKLTLLKKV